MRGVKGVSLRRESGGGGRRDGVEYGGQFGGYYLVFFRLLGFPFCKVRGSG